MRSSSSNTSGRPNLPARAATATTFVVTLSALEVLHGTRGARPLPAPGRRNTERRSTMALNVDAAVMPAAATISAGVMRGISDGAPAIRADVGVAFCCAAGAASCNDDALAMRAARCGVLDIDEVVARAKRAREGERAAGERAWETLPPQAARPSRTRPGRRDLSEKKEDHPPGWGTVLGYLVRPVGGGGYDKHLHSDTNTQTHAQTNTPKY